MIQRLTLKQNIIDVYDFVKNTKDYYEDCYVTFDKQRFFLNNIKVVKKILKYQTVYGLFNKELEGLLIIFRQKGFRPYIKILTKNSIIERDLLKFLQWNFEGCNLYAKIKKNNSLFKRLLFINPYTKKPRYGFSLLKSRGDECLLFHPSVKVKKTYINLREK